MTPTCHSFRAARLPAGACCALLALSAARSPPAAARRRGAVHFDGRTVEVPRGLAGLPARRAPADVRAARPARGLPGDAGAATSAARPSAIGRRRAILVEPRGARRAPRRCRRCRGRRATASAGGSVFTGLGFDACTAPSSRSMAAWERLALPGDRRLHRRRQPRLLAAEPDRQLGQRPDRSRLAPDPDLRRPAGADQRLQQLRQAQRQPGDRAGRGGGGRRGRRGGRGGDGPGQPDLLRHGVLHATSSATAATLAFLEAWTEKLHALGYVSGVYSSSASGIDDLAGQIGSGYDLPDDLWFANWNGQANTADPYVPASAWSQHQRIHQYRGGHDETYGGVTINIDNNYVDGATVGTAAPAAGDEDPVGSLDLVGSPGPGPGAGQGLGLRPQRPDRTAGDPRLRRRPGRRPRRRSPTTSARSPTGSRRDVGAEFRRSRAAATASTQPSRRSSRGRSRSASTRSTSAPATTACSAARRRRSRSRSRLSDLKATRDQGPGLGRLRWPAGTDCPGQLAPPHPVQVAVAHRRGRRPRTRAVTRSLGRRAFQLTGGAAHGFAIPLSAGGRALLRAARRAARRS